MIFSLIQKNYNEKTDSRIHAHVLDFQKCKLVSPIPIWPYPYLSIIASDKYSRNCGPLVVRCSLGMNLSIEVVELKDQV